MAESGSKNSGNDEVPGRIEETLCEPCLNKDKRIVAVKFCSSCNEFQCTDCSNVHDILPILKGHKLVYAREMKAKQDLFDLKGLDQCDQHQEVLKFFCEDESQLCCGTCANADHHKCHSVVEIQKIAGMKTSQCSNLREKLQAVKENAQLVARNIISSKQTLEQDAEKLPGTIRQMRDQVVEMFNHLEASVFEKVEIFKKETLADLQTKQAQNESHIDEATHRLETINNVHKNGTPPQQFIIEQKMKSHVNRLYNKINEECWNVQRAFIFFQFDETLKLPPQPVSQYVPGKLTLKSIVNTVTSPMRLKPEISINLKQIEDDIKEPLYSGMDFLPDGRLVAVDNYNNKCLVYNEKLEKVASYQLAYPPISVAVVFEDNVAITKYNQYEIDILNINEGNKITLVKTCKLKSRYESICLKDDVNFVAGTVDDPVPARIVSYLGEEKDFSIKLPNKTYHYATRVCMYLRNRNKIVITDRYEDTVYIYDDTTGARVVVKDDQIQRPRGVTVGPCHTILVCSNGTHSIVQITETGQILSSCKIHMYRPYKICFSQFHSYLIVTNNEVGNKKLQKFKIS